MDLSRPNYQVLVVTVSEHYVALTWANNMAVVLGDLSIETYQNPPLDVILESGYPELDNKTVPPCNFYGPQPTCTRERKSMVL